MFVRKKDAWGGSLPRHFGLVKTQFRQPEQELENF
jgi:hypothetical protein